VMTHQRSSPPELGPASPVEADNMSAVGIADRSVNREWRKREGRSGTPDYEKRLKKEESKLAKKACHTCGVMGHLARRCKGKGKEIVDVEATDEEGMGHTLGLL